MDFEGDGLRSDIVGSFSFSFPKVDLAGDSLRMRVVRVGVDGVSFVVEVLAAIGRRFSFTGEGVREEGPGRAWVIDEPTGIRLSLIGEAVRDLFKGDTKGRAGWGIFLFRDESSVDGEDDVFPVDNKFEVFVREAGVGFTGDAPEDRVVLLLLR